MLLFCEFNREADQNVISTIFSHHDMILHELKLLESDLHKRIELHIQNLIELKQKNMEFEEEQLYPQFDLLLSPERREAIKKVLDRDSRYGFYPIEKVREYYKTRNCL